MSINNYDIITRPATIQYPDCTIDPIDLFRGIVNERDLKNAKARLLSKEFSQDFCESLLLICCEEGSSILFDYLCSLWSEKPHLKPIPKMVDGCVPIQKAYLNGHIKLAEQIFNYFGMEQFTPLFQSDLFILIGLKEEFKEGFFSFVSQMDVPARYFLKRDVLKYLSNLFDAVIEGNDDLSLEDLKEAIALKKAQSPFLQKCPIDFTDKQLELYTTMQSIDRLRHFPFSKLWRFGIDGHSHDSYGCCGYETEPRYMKAFFNGLNQALITAHGKKTDNWVVHLHNSLIEGNYRSLNDRPLWDLRTDVMYLQSTEIRVAETGFELRNCDRDPIGLSDLYQRGILKPNKESKWTRLEHPATRRLTQLFKLKQLMEDFELLLSRCQTRAYRIMTYLWLSREIEIYHFFRDANGRTAICALMGLIISDPDLFFPLYYNPNILDGNGPESLAFRYIEACQNFLAHGTIKGHILSEEIKTLSSFKFEPFIPEHPSGTDLIALFEELKALNLESLTWNGWKQKLLRV